MKQAVDVEHGKTQPDESAIPGAPGKSCLLQVRSMEELAAEIRRAVEAIGSNEPAQFRDSVERQRTLAGELSLALAETPSRISIVEAPQAWRTRYEQAAHALRQLNEEYAALIEHSGQSIEMLARLRQTSGDPSAARWSVNA